VRVEFIDTFFEALGWDVRNVQGRGEHEDMPDNQDRVAAGVGGMVGLRRAVARWQLRGIIGVMSLWVSKRPSIRSHESQDKTTLPAFLPRRTPQRKDKAIRQNDRHKG